MDRSFYVEITCPAWKLGAEEFEDHVSDMMDALQEEPGVIDADIGARLAVQAVDFCLHLNAPDLGGALRYGLEAVHSALRSAGNATTGWTKMTHALEVDNMQVTARPADLITT